MLIIDVREPEEYAAGHVNGAINIPLAQLGDDLGDFHTGDRDEDIVVYCNSGARAEAARTSLQSLGYSHVVNGINQKTIEQNL